LAVTLNDSCDSLLPISLAKFVVLLRLDKLSLVPHSSVALFLDGSFIACHLPLPAGAELAGVWLREGGGAQEVAAQLKKAAPVASRGGLRSCRGKRQHSSLLHLGDTAGGGGLSPRQPP
jgi:hypothetical protein